MNKTVVIVLSITLMVIVLLLGSTQLGSNVRAQVPTAEVVILRCSVSAPVSSIPIAMSSNGSVNAPVVRRGTTCAQGLAELMNLGFEIRDVESAGAVGTNLETDLYYTLVSTNP